MTWNWIAILLEVHSAVSPVFSTFATTEYITGDFPPSIYTNPVAIPELLPKELLDATISLFNRHLSQPIISTGSHSPITGHSTQLRRCLFSATVSATGFEGARTHHSTFDIRVLGRDRDRDRAASIPCDRSLYMYTSFF